MAEQSEIKKSRSKAEKEAEKQQKAIIQEIYGWAIVDGRREKVANFTVEPPGLFLGRGKHPKTGKIKKRIMPEDIIINIGEESPIPACPLEDHDWKEVVHNPGVSWLAYWKESINGGAKYVWLAASSSIKGRADRDKFEVARKLKVLPLFPPFHYISSIRNQIFIFHASNSLFLQPFPRGQTHCRHFLFIFIQS